MSKHLWIACCLSVSLGIAGLSLHAQPPSDKTKAVEKVLADWKHRLDRFKSVRYVITGKTEKKDLPKGSKLPAVRSAKFVVLIDLVNRWVRIEKNGSGFNPTKDRYSPDVTVTAYDGKSQQTNLDREVNEIGPTNPDVAITKGSLRNTQFENELWPLLCAHGIVPTVNKPPRADRLPTRHTAEEFESRGEVNRAGVRCLILRTDPLASTPFLVDEFWIDPARESAIVRQVYFAGKNPWLRFDTVFQKSKDGWLPTSWTFAHTASHLVEVSRFTVESMEVDPPVTNADFVLPIPPGSIVGVQTFPEEGIGLDPHKPANGIFRVDSSGKWIPLGEETGFTTGDGRVLPPESPSRRWLWWSGAALIGLVTVATIVVLYRRRIRRITKS
jgi:hypothetical protein